MLGTSQKNHCVLVVKIQRKSLQSLQLEYKLTFQEKEKKSLFAQLSRISKKSTYLINYMIIDKMDQHTYNIQNLRYRQ